MSRYRKIDIRMHGDAVIASLSRPQPNARSLWDHLLYGPSTGIIPGLYRAREAQLADELRWGLEPFRKQFQELSTARSRLGFDGVLVRADWDAGLVWIPNALKYDPPANPNVVKHWADALDELPECSLKAEAFLALGAHCEARGRGFVQAFERLPKPSVNSFLNGSLNRMPNQEQEQEQEQEKESAERTLPPNAAGAAAPVREPKKPTPAALAKSALSIAVKAMAERFGHDVPPTASKTHIACGASKVLALMAKGVEPAQAAERVAIAAYERLAAKKASSFGWALNDCVLGAVAPVDTRKRNADGKIELNTWGLP